MIENKALGVKIAENPEEALLKTAYDNSETRIRQLKLSIEIEGVVFEYLKKKLKK